MASGGLVGRRGVAALAGLTAAVLLVPAIPAGACTRVGSVTVGECRRPPSSSRQPKKKATSPESVLLQEINRERRAAGLRPLKSDRRARVVAEEHARRMARRGRVYHNPELDTRAGRDRLGNPSAIGENVGVGPSARSVHAAFMRSHRHRRNILYANFRRVGLGAVWKNGSIWVVEVFVTNGAGGRPSVPARTSAPRLHHASYRPSASRPAVSPATETIRGMNVGSPTRPVASSLDHILRAARGDTEKGAGFPGIALVGVIVAAGVALWRRRVQTARTSA